MVFSTKPKVESQEISFPSPGLVTSFSTLHLKSPPPPLPLLISDKSPYSHIPRKSGNTLLLQRTMFFQFLQKNVKSFA